MGTSYGNTGDTSLTKEKHREENSLQPGTRTHAKTKQTNKRDTTLIPQKETQGKLHMKFSVNGFCWIWFWNSSSHFATWSPQLLSFACSPVRISIFHLCKKPIHWKINSTGRLMKIPSIARLFREIHSVQRTTNILNFDYK